jgi:hypothetical protein
MPAPGDFELDVRRLRHLSTQCKIKIAATGNKKAAIARRFANDGPRSSQHRQL